MSSKTRRLTPIPITNILELAPKVPLHKQKTTGVDTISRVVGDFGIWQLRTALIIFLCKIPAAWFMACIIFTAPELYPGTEFQCAKEEDQHISDNQCSVSNVTSGETNTCHEFSYDSSFYSLIMQFDLVCDRDIFIAWTQFWHLFGILVGGVVATKMMIWISPRNVMLVGMISQIGCGVATGYVPDFSLHCFFRCASAVCCAIMMTSGQTIFTEITGGNYKIGLVALYDTFWSVGLFFLPTLASFFTTWGQIYLGISFPTVILIVSIIWIPEAPRWLLKNKKDVASVEAILLNGASINDRLYLVPNNLKEELKSLSETLQSQPPPASWLDLWSGPKAKTHIVASHLALSLFIISFMGMLLNTRSFGREYLGVNTVVTGISEVVGCFMASLVALYWNKWKWQCSGLYNIIAGLIGCSGWLFPLSLIDPWKEVAYIVISSLSKAGVSFAQSLMLACLPELWPANKKVPFMFSLVTFARVWLLSAPFFNVLKKIDINASLSSYCIMNIIGGVCLLFILTPKPPPPTVVVSGERMRNNLEVVWDIENTVNGCDNKSYTGDAISDNTKL